jgi:hypothetical protein
LHGTHQRNMFAPMPPSGRLAAFTTGLIRAMCIGALVALAPMILVAQQKNEAPVCLGFAFGTWTPALDWRAAGHVTPLDTRTNQGTADGRDWATTQAVQNEHTIILLPFWWPAGVSVKLPNRSPAIGDTVVGSAFAFVGDGRRTTPVSQVRAWRVACTPRAP